jgi:hypothetical protein
MSTQTLLASVLILCAASSAPAQWSGLVSDPPAPRRGSPAQLRQQALDTKKVQDARIREQQIANYRARQSFTNQIYQKLGVPPPPHPNSTIRIIDGELCDTLANPDWVTLNGSMFDEDSHTTITIAKMLKGGDILCDREFYERTRANSGSTLKKVDQIIIRHLAGEKATIGSPLAACKALRLHPKPGDGVPVYDCGLSDTPENRKTAGIGIPTHEQVVEAQKQIAGILAAEKARQREATNAKRKAADAKSLAWHMEQAAKGDAYGLLRLGQRYRNGTGVEKDLDKAKDYLSKAAAAGSPTAEEELKALNESIPAGTRAE